MWDVWTMRLNRKFSRVLTRNVKLKLQAVVKKHKDSWNSSLHEGWKAHLPVVQTDPNRLDTMNFDLNSNNACKNTGKLMSPKLQPIFMLKY